MMRDIHLGVRLPFDTPEDREASESFLMGILGFNCMVNHRYLKKHPSTPLLYDSGVVYKIPDQLDENRASRKSIERVERVLRSEGVDAHTVDNVLRILSGIEEFLDIPSLYQRGRGDCNELAPVRVAELWRAGIPASPYLTKERNNRGGITYHALVLWPDGSSEDPSLILGMGGPSRVADRAEEIRKNQERLSYFVKAAQLMIEEGADLVEVERQIELLGLLPKNGTFHG